MGPEQNQVAPKNFPFLAHKEPRPGQIEMIQESREALRNNGHHLAAAPTGIGKTAAALAAAIEISRSSDHPAPILFLTGRQSQHTIVVNTIRSINERLPEGERPVKVADIIGRNDMCKDVDMLSGKCFCEHGTSDDSKQSGREEVRNFILQFPRHVEEIIDKSRVWGVCPWAICRSAVRDSDILVCDYNHVFAEAVREKSLGAMSIDLAKCILIVDEAHNLPDRIRMSMERVITPSIVRSAEVDLNEYVETLTELYQKNASNSVMRDLDMATWAWEIIKIARAKTADLFRQLHTDLLRDKEESHVEVQRLVDVIHRSCDEYEGVTGQKTLSEQPVAGKAQVQRRNRLLGLADILLKVQIDQDAGDDEEDTEIHAHRLGHILKIIETYGDTPALSLVFSTKGKEGKITSHLLDPGLVSGPLFASTKGSILMSGTLYPPQMYADILDLPKQKTTKTAYNSPFAGERRPVLVAGDVTTKYTQRSMDMWAKIRAHLQALIDETPGHLAVFFPSYKIMEEILGERTFKGVSKSIESRDWSKQDIDEIVPSLKEKKEKNQRVMLCGVYGARLSEGIDYNGGILDAVACIGIPNAPPSVLSSALKDYAGERFGANNAWRYTVTQPAINAILQAMGRPIRSIGDRALILLLDQRHTDRTYATCYPKDLRMNSTNAPTTTASFARRFFSRVHTIDEV
ncbi:MAG TPA: ATP-dependent DNA helicase [Candidatus Poseidoniales archaeon]|nr:MAG TPA: ATP-dependent DNA helicase [Candidatus Poseidoniales archaeon]HII87856.1 ATP-dependent DNA helicase [Candidatus Poseidoniaceae archaeon]